MGDECDISADRSWRGQYYCGIHSVWWRDDGDEPTVCPAGEVHSSGRLEGLREAIQVCRDTEVCIDAYAEGQNEPEFSAALHRADGVRRCAAALRDLLEVR